MCREACLSNIVAAIKAAGLDPRSVETQGPEYPDLPPIVTVPEHVQGQEHPDLPLPR